MRKEKSTVRSYYDKIGWLKNDSNKYMDTVSFVDMRPVLNTYYHRTHIRVMNYFKPIGEYLLDIGSGAIPHSEFLEYSAQYGKHVCVDFSIIALREVEKKLGKRGVYELEDATKLKFADNTFDTIIASHILYHIPSDEQEAAVLEWYRVLKPGGTCIIIYSWRIFLRTTICKVLQILGINKYPLYSYRHNHRWFKDTFRKLDIEICCWRSVSPISTKIFIHGNFGGQFLLKILFWLETVFPHILGRIGRYPMIIIRK